MRQQDRVLAALTRGPVCADTEWNPRIKRLAARIGDLKKRGWLIDTPTCPLHSHQLRTIAYVLTNSPGVLQPDLARYATPPHPLTTLFGSLTKPL